MARDLLAKAEAKGVKFLLPKDVVVADKFAADAGVQERRRRRHPDGWLGLMWARSRPRSFRTSSPRRRRWSGTGPWASSSSTTSRRVLLRSPTPSAVWTGSRSSAAATPWRRWRRPVWRRRCPTSRRAAAHPSSWRARCAGRGRSTTRGWGGGGGGGGELCLLSLCRASTASRPDGGSRCDVAARGRVAFLRTRDRVEKAART